MKTFADIITAGDQELIKKCILDRSIKLEVTVTELMVMSEGVRCYGLGAGLSTEQIEEKFRNFTLDQRLKTITFAGDLYRMLHSHLAQAEKDLLGVTEN